MNKLKINDIGTILIGKIDVNEYINLIFKLLF